MQCWSSHLPVLALLLLGGHALGQVLGEGGDTSIGETTIENSESKELLLPSPKSASEETDSSPARQRPQQGGSWGGLLSGKNEWVYQKQRMYNPKAFGRNKNFHIIFE